MNLSFSGIAVLLVLIVVVISNVSKGIVTLTPDTPPTSGSYCPEDVVKLTCRTINVTSSSLRWFHDGSTGITELSYLFSTNDSYPLSRNTSSLNGFSNYTIVNAILNQEVRTIVDFTAELVIDLGVLFELGYRSLECGSRDEKESFPLNLDIEAPLAFQVVRVDLFYNATSSDSLDLLVIQTERPGYTGTMCQYRTNSFLNTSIRTGSDTFQNSTAINDSNCERSTCTIALPGVAGESGDLVVSVVAENEFDRTTATPPSIMFSSSLVENFNFVLENETDCGVCAMCTANETLGVTSCMVSYRTDPTYQNFSNHSRESNSSQFCLTASERITYYIESVFKINSSGVDVYYHLRRPPFMTKNTCSVGAPTLEPGMPTTEPGDSDTVAVAAVVPIVVVLAIAVIVVSVIVAVFAFRHPRQKISHAEINDGISQDRDQVQIVSLQPHTTEPQSSQETAKDMEALIRDPEFKGVDGEVHDDTAERGEVHDDIAEGHSLDTQTTEPQHSQEAIAEDPGSKPIDDPERMLIVGGPGFKQQGENTQTAIKREVDEERKTHVYEDVS